MITGVLVVLKQFKHIIQKRNQTRTMMLKGNIPLSVPMGMGNDMCRFLHSIDSFFADKL